MVGRAVALVVAAHLVVAVNLFGGLLLGGVHRFRGRLARCRCAANGGQTEHQNHCHQYTYNFFHNYYFYIFAYSLISYPIICPFGAFPHKRQSNEKKSGQANFFSFCLPRKLLYVTNWYISPLSIPQLISFLLCRLKYVTNIFLTANC